MKSVASKGPIPLPLNAVHPFRIPAALMELQEEEPICRLSYLDGTVGWLVTSHALAKSILTDSRIVMYPELSTPIPIAVRGGEMRDALQDEGVFSANLVETNPPRHTQLRRLLAPHFTAARVDEYRGVTSTACDRALDAMVSSGPPADIVRDFTLPVVSATHAAVLGVSQAEGDRLVDVSAILFDPSVPVERCTTELRDLKKWLTQVIEEKREHPGDDLMSTIAAGEDLSLDEAMSLSLTLAISGHDATSGMIASSVFALLCYPEQQEALGSDPSLINGAVEEFLRYFTLLKATNTRVAREDVEVGGQLVREGEYLTISVSAVNRDSEKFPDPNHLDIRRNARGHMAFSHGIHVCLGQHLARMEMRVAIAALVARLPDLRLAGLDSEVLTESSEHPFHMVKKLPVAW